MSDAYNLNDFVKGYNYYREAIKLLNAEKSLKETAVFGEIPVPEDLVERAMGSEIAILKAGDESALVHEILKAVPEQIEYIYMKSTESVRKNMKLLSSLEEKLIQLKGWLADKEYHELSNIVAEYIKKCKSYY